jgi:hypothetical protein
VRSAQPAASAMRAYEGKHLPSRRLANTNKSGNGSGFGRSGA